MTDTQERWLETFAAHFQAATLSSTAFRAVHRRPSLRARVTDSGGWFVTIAQLRNRVDFSVFLDLSAGRKARHVWYGFSSKQEEEVTRIAELSGYTPIVDNTPRRLRDDEFGTLFIEHPSEGEYYAGIYILDARDIGLPDAAFLAGKVMRETEAWFASIADSLRTEASTLPTNDENWLSERAHREVLARRGQPAFRRRLIDAYAGKCCITGCEVLALLDAAHIRTIAGRDDHSIGNGLLLRTDIHTLLDTGMAAIDPANLTFHVSPLILDSTYRVLDGVRLRIPASLASQINRRTLKHRWQKLRWSVAPAR